MENNMVNWAPLHQHSAYSLLDGYSNIDDIASYCKKQGYRAAALTDHGVVSGAVDFAKACQKNGIKPILGCELYVCDGFATDRTGENRGLSHLVVLCKNLVGWYELVKLVSMSNRKENMYYKPRVDYDMLKKYLGNGNHIAISGHPGSTLADFILGSDSYNATDIDSARKCLPQNWKELATNCIDKHCDIFGAENFFVEIQLIDRQRLHMAEVLAECFREIVKESNGKYRPVATADSHYVRKSDAIYQRILLCSSLHLTLPEVEYKIKAGKDIPLKGFFVSDNYHIPEFHEMEANHTVEELSNSILITEMCENYNILSAPKFPKFECPGGKKEIEYLKELCEEGFKKLSIDKDPVVYRERLELELKVIEEANLSGYFLIVWDIINFLRENNKMTPLGRGSAAGCLVSYLTGIVGIDPIEHDLMFERFYNASRAGSLPDIDIDVPSEFRDEVIEYIKKKYGEKHVCQMATFGSLMGRSAVKEVLRVEGELGFAEINEMTEHIPDEAEIADELENMEEKSIILWSLQNRPKKFERWCTLNEDGTFSGPYAESFGRAMKMEGTYKSQGKHAAGVIISSDIIEDVCPIVIDKHDKAVAAFSMKPMEALGHIKFDILGVSVMDKIWEIVPFLPDGRSIHDMKDPDVWKDLSEGDVKGVFQLELQKRWTKKLKPENIDHLAALLAIIRPGVVEAIEKGKSMTEWYIDRKNGKEPNPVVHDAVDPILNKTHGVIVYQETAMKLANVVAGFDLKEADNLRKAIGKKDTALMAEVKTKFLNGSKAISVVPYELSERIFDNIEKSQRYSFNASHSYSYAYNAYYTAYCKHYAPLKFYEVYLNHAKSKPDTIKEMKELINDAKMHGIEVLGPNLANFNYKFTMNVDLNHIHFGISNIKEVGEEAHKLMELREELGDKFKDLSWIEILIHTHIKKINKKAMKGLMLCGALNGKNNKTHRAQMFHEYMIFKDLTDKEVAYVCNSYEASKSLSYHFEKLINNHKITKTRLIKVKDLKTNIDKPPSNTKDTEFSISSDERNYMGVSITNYEFLEEEFSIVTSTCLDVAMGKNLGHQTICGYVSDVREHKIAKPESKLYGQKMAFVCLEDSSGEFKSIIAFPEIYNEYKSSLVKSNKIIISGKVESRQGEYSLICDRIIQA